MATINIGRIKFVWQGAYSGGSSYVPDDIVSYNGSSYVCTASTTGNLPTNTTYWSVMASKGTDGTDITSISGLAQGDILYYDGSNWVRLGAGTSGQVLTTGGAGANPSWGTVSSDFVKLVETNNVSSGTISVDGYFSSDYETYKLVINNLYGASFASGSRISMRLNQSGSAVSSGFYHAIVPRAWYDNTGSNASGVWFGVWNHTYVDLGYVYNQDDASTTSNMELTIYNPLSTASKKMVHINFSGWDSAVTNISHHWGQAVLESTTALSGITIAPYAFGSGILKASSVKLYGLK